MLVRLPSWTDPKQFAKLLRRLHRQDWVVYAKPAFGGPSQVLRYLGRYTHRIAISNHRLLAFDGESVTFRWKDYAHGGKQKKMTLLATEFLRRFFLHVLPKGFVRIRHFGFLTNRHRASRLSLCRTLLSCEVPCPPGTRTTYRHCSPVALSTMRHGDDHHPQAFVDRDIDAVCQFRLILEQRHSFGPTTRAPACLPTSVFKVPTIALYATGNRHQNAISLAELPKLCGRIRQSAKSPSDAVSRIGIEIP